MTPTNITQQQAAWTLEDIYNFFMEPIEPELTTWVLPDLDTLYPEEEGEERRDRMERYARAFEVFGDRIALASEQWKQAVVSYGERAVEEAKQKTCAEEESEVSDIGHAIDSFGAS